MWVSKKRFEELSKRVRELEGALEKSGIYSKTDFIFDIRSIASSVHLLNVAEFKRDIEAYLNIEKVSEPPRYQKRKSQGKGR